MPYDEGTLKFGTFEIYNQGFGKKNYIMKNHLVIKFAKRSVVISWNKNMNAKDIYSIKKFIFFKL